ncbi:ABC transporter ATP-binding protein [Ilumatobacter nonamiensis]|uniref:ABC transporter ATP-binding protein n=1 Tax=Ilumatobacter nonamiensis TaxID=467093 RepID=UPI00034CB288|nr:ABC transporter ATP-binding protein [Ilumatobacter nonamiensis]
MAAIEVRDLHKHYGDNHAVRGVSFDVRPGEVYALLGPNGAGKTTVVEILEGHRAATSGEVSVLGFDPSKAERDFRDRIGVVLQSSGVENEFTVREVLEIYGSAYRTRRSTEEVLQLTGLEAKADERVGSLSGGQRRRVDLALGIVGTPDLLFLDEPTTGFDPSARRLAWDLIEELGAGGTTVLLTTHYLDEAEHLADRVGVLAHGALIAEDTPSALIDGISGTVVSFQLPESIAPGDAVATFGPLIDAPVRVSGRLVEATVEHSTSVVQRLTGWAVEQDIELAGLSVTRASLEDVYLQLTDHDAHGDPTQEGTA